MMIEGLNNRAFADSSAAVAIPAAIDSTQKAETLEQAAEQFEALFLRTLLQQMRKTADVIADEDSPFNSRQQRLIRDFYDDELARTLASQRSSGIADLLIQQLQPQVTANKK